jgi:hypothetical protein
MKKSPAVKMDSGVAYSDINVVQPRQGLKTSSKRKKEL